MRVLTATSALVGSLLLAVAAPLVAQAAPGEMTVTYTITDGVLTVTANNELPSSGGVCKWTLTRAGEQPPRVGTGPTTVAFGDRYLARTSVYTWPAQTLADGSYRFFWACETDFPRGNNQRNAWGTAPYLPTDNYPNDQPTTTPPAITAGPPQGCSGSLCFPGIG